MALTISSEPASKSMAVARALIEGGGVYSYIRVMPD